jgi:hypothetical protein
LSALACCSSAESPGIETSLITTQDYRRWVMWTSPAFFCKHWVRVIRVWFTQLRKREDTFGFCQMEKRLSVFAHWWWDDFRVAKTALPIQIKLKNPSQFPHQKEYPSSMKEDKASYLSQMPFKKRRVLISCSRPYNTPILAVCKGPNKWKLVQDLQLINSAVIPLHPIARNPYTLLAQILSKSQYYCVLDLKDTFFFHSSVSWQSASVCLQRSHKHFTTNNLVSFGTRVQGQPPPFWTDPNQRLTRLALPRGHPSSICWWPTSVQSHRAPYLQGNWVPFEKA